MRLLLLMAMVFEISNVYYTQPRCEMALLRGKDEIDKWVESNPYFAVKYLVLTIILGIPYSILTILLMVHQYIQGYILVGISILMSRKKVRAIVFDRPWIYAIQCILYLGVIVWAYLIT